MTKRILDIVDMQNDFMDPKGALYVPGADNIIPLANRFLQEVRKNDFDAVLIKYDTHFQETYAQNPESKMFPPHCVFNTRGWKLAINVPENLTKIIPTYRMEKNVFDMWARHANIKKPTFTDHFNKQTYEGLFTVQGFKAKQNATSRDREQFMKELDIGPDTEVTMIGVASDFCVKDAMKGYLKRGANVTIIEDLVKGIADDMRDVVKRDEFRNYTLTGRLRVITLQTYYEEQNTEVENGHRFENKRRAAKSRGR